MNKAKMLAFSILLAVPATLTGCSDNQDECDPYYDDQCEYDDSSGYYYYSGGSGGYYGGSGHRYTSDSSSKHSGFGSSGTHSSRGG